MAVFLVDPQGTTVGLFPAYLVDSLVFRVPFRDQGLARASQWQQQ